MMAPSSYQAYYPDNAGRFCLEPPPSSVFVGRSGAPSPDDKTDGRLQPAVNEMCTACSKAADDGDFGRGFASIAFCIAAHNVCLGIQRVGHWSSQETFYTPSKAHAQAISPRVAPHAAGRPSATTCAAACRAGAGRAIFDDIHADQKPTLPARHGTAVLSFHTPNAPLLRTFAGSSSVHASAPPSIGRRYVGIDCPTWKPHHGKGNASPCRAGRPHRPHEGAANDDWLCRRLRK